MILYWPAPSVVADRTFSISAGLAASTVTPGRTAPDVSLTVPAMVLVWADATTGNNARHAAAMNNRANVRMPSLLLQVMHMRPIRDRAIVQQSCPALSMSFRAFCGNPPGTFQFFVFKVPVTKCRTLKDL